MVQSVFIEFSVLNALPGVSGVEDVEFDVPEVRDIRQLVENIVPTVGELADEIEERVRDLLDDLELDPEIDLGTIEFPAVDLLAEELVEELTGLDGFFGPVQDDFEDALEDVLGSLPAEIDSIGEALTLLAEGIESLQTTLDELEVPTIEEIEATVTAAVTDALEETLPDWLGLSLEEFVDELFDRLADRLVSEEAVNNLASALEGV